MVGLIIVSLSKSFCCFTYFNIRQILLYFHALKAVVNKLDKF